MLHKKAKQSGSAIVRLLLAVALAVGAVFVFTQRQAIADHISVWSYDPPAEIAQLADRASMNDQGRFYFYASKPKLLGAQQFNGVCADHYPDGATLGCYSGGLIYIYDIDDERLDGIREVTAAHEMLHAVYARMSESEKSEINRMIDDAYASLENEKLTGRLEIYERNQPGTRYVELHAIVGTEFKNITPELEAHYAEVFKDRQAVVALHESYLAQFTERENRANEIKQRLDTLSSTIETASSRYNRDVQTLSRNIESFNSRAGSVDSEAERQSLIVERQSLLTSTNNLEARRNQIDGWIAEYNTLVQEYNSIATEVRELTDSIDSNLNPAPSV